MTHTDLTNTARGILAAALIGLLTAGAFAADRIELTDGSVVMGKLLSADGGKLKVETAFAGTIEIAQAQVKTFATDDTVVVGLNGGSTVKGKVEMADAGIKIVAKDGQMCAATGNVAAVWRVGAGQSRGHQAQG